MSRHAMLMASKDTYERIEFDVDYASDANSLQHRTHVSRSGAAPTSVSGGEDIALNGQAHYVERVSNLDRPVISAY